MQKQGRATTIHHDPFGTVIPQLVEDEPIVAQGVITKESVEVRDEATQIVRMQTPTPKALSRELPARKLGRAKLTLHLEADLVERIKNAVYWIPGLTIAKVGMEAMRKAIEKIEKENGGVFKLRESELVTGRQIK